MQSRLAEMTLHLVVNRPKTLSLQRIANDTGLSRHWLVNFLYKRCDVNHVSVAHVECLYEYLSKKTLSL